MKLDYIGLFSPPVPRPRTFCALFGFLW